MSEQIAMNPLVVQHSHRVPDEPVAKTLAACREQFFRVAEWVRRHCPASRETSLVQTKIDEARMWACNAITLKCPIREPVGEPARKSWLAWMIERPGPNGPEYLTMQGGLVAWTTEPLIGLQFVRREDADRMAAESNESCSIREHEFCG